MTLITAMHTMLDFSFTEELRTPLGASLIAPHVVAEPGRIEDIARSSRRKCARPHRNTHSRPLLHAAALALAHELELAPRLGDLALLLLPGVLVEALVTERPEVARFVHLPT